MAAKRAKKPKSFSTTGSSANIFPISHHQSLAISHFVYIMGCNYKKSHVKKYQNNNVALAPLNRSPDITTPQEEKQTNSTSTPVKNIAQNAGQPSTQQNSIHSVVYSLIERLQLRVPLINGSILLHSL